jgi:hypothetical protein
VGGRLSEGHAIAIDSAGNRYLTGLSRPSTSISYMLLDKYDLSGTRVDPGSATMSGAVGNGIALDSAGNIYVAGYYNNPVFPTQQLLVMKYDPSFHAVWTNLTIVSSQAVLDTCNAITVGSDNNLYVAGTIRTTVNIGGFTVTNGTGPAVYLEKLNTNGTVLWATTAAANNATAAIGGSLATDAAGNIFITGTFGTGTVFGASTTLANVGGSKDIFVAKYDNSGGLLWVQSAGSTADDTGGGLALDGAGNVYLTGILGGAASFTNGMSVPAGGLFLAKYDNSGNLLWV